MCIRDRSSGLRAVQGTATTSKTMLIADLSRAIDSYELYTRAYAYGGGIGSGRLTMEKTTRSTAGYTPVSYTHLTLPTSDLV